MQPLIVKSRSKATNRFLSTLNSKLNFKPKKTEPKLGFLITRCCYLHLKGVAQYDGFYAIWAGRNDIDGCAR